MQTIPVGLGAVAWENPNDPFWTAIKSAGVLVLVTFALATLSERKTHRRYTQKEDRAAARRTWAKRGAAIQRGLSAPFRKLGAARRAFSSG